MNQSELENYLRDRGLIGRSRPRIVPLAGGVSSDVFLVDDDSKQFVVKRALEKLRVRDAWYCDTSRNIVEYEAIRYVSDFCPKSVPNILHFDRDYRLFVMEHLGPEYEPWKSQLLRGDINPETAVQAAEVLASLHLKSWHHPVPKRQFSTDSNFIALRIEPYLLTTGRRHPKLSAIFEVEANRLQRAPSALVHGDWSPKNMLVSPDRFVVLDWEVAWYGDPAFDSAFLYNLLLLKSLVRQELLSEYTDIMRRHWTTYSRLMPHFSDDLARRIVHLTLLLLLARIDGKSPVEYVHAEEDKNLVRAFVTECLLSKLDQLNDVLGLWRKALLVR